MITNKDKEFLRDALGEGLHVAFRKGSDCDEADKIHKLITKMPDAEWSKIIDFVAWGMGLDKE
jgi:hypothetical protein